MIGILTNDFEIGIEIKKKIEELKIVIHTENYFYINGYKQIIYLYSDEEIKAKHKREMIHNGLKPIDGQDYMHIYYCFYDTDENNATMLIPCQVYEKRIKCSLV